MIVKKKIKNKNKNEKTFQIVLRSTTKKTSPHNTRAFMLNNIDVTDLNELQTMTLLIGTDYWNLLAMSRPKALSIGFGEVQTEFS